MCNVNLLLQMSYTYKIDEVEKCLNDTDGCMMVSHRMLQKQVFTDAVRTTAAASVAEGREILKSLRPMLKSLRRICEAQRQQTIAACSTPLVGSYSYQ